MRKRDFISIFYGMLDHNNNTFCYSNCGHNPALHLSSQKINLLEGSGPSLNLLKDAKFKNFEIQLEKNDQILLYTDGVVEVFNKDKKQFGLERLTDIFKSNIDKSPKEIIDKIISSTKEFSSSNSYSDDFTLLALKRNN
jgi:sigma-B regulation protein RsbU (phosphoserine phosphatase)